MDFTSETTAPAMTRPVMPSFWRYANAISYGWAIFVLGIFFLGLEAFEFGLTETFIRSMPQDLFLQLDGIYRLSIGQHIYTDFTTPIGLGLYALPLLFVHSTADIVLSVNYSIGLLLAVTFLMVVYLTRTRLTPLLGVALGIWLGLALAARMNFGDGPTVVSTGGIYNRESYVALALALLLFLPPRKRGVSIGLADGAIYAILAAFQLYMKFTFGLVALAFAPIVLLRQQNRLTAFATFAIVFGLLVLSVEYGYGTHFQWLHAVQMTVAASTGSVSNINGYAHALIENFPELLVCTVVPIWFLWHEGRLTPLTLVFVVMVAGASLALIQSNGQGSFLFIPTILFFVAASSLDPQSGESFPRPENAWFGSRQAGLIVVTIALLVLQSGPLLLNMAYSAYWSLTQPPLVADNPVLKQIVARPELFEDRSNLRTTPILNGQVSPLDAFVIGRYYHPWYPTDTVTLLEYRDYLVGGMSAAQKGCDAGSRLATLDLGNPFPLLLGWPAGGYALVIHPDRILSVRARPSEEQMFKGVNCVLVPKMPVKLEARDFMLDAYGSFLSGNFRTSYQTPLWTVLKRTVPSVVPTTTPPR
jgi:hypothetical protein